jgi:hypothetical protein
MHGKPVCGRLSMPSNGEDIMKALIFALVGLFLPIQMVGLAQVPIRVEGWPYITRTLNFAEWAVPAFAYDVGEIHLFYNTFTGEINKFRTDGTSYPGWPVISDTTIFGHTPIVVDIDHDGRYEVLTYGARRDGGYLYSLIYLIDDDGSTMPGFPIHIQHPMTLNAVDLDDDNEYEIISCAEDVDLIYCLDRFGNSKPGWPISFHLPGIEQGYSVKSASIADLDLDGDNEYIIQGVWGIYAFRYDGSMQPGFPILMQDTTYYFFNAWLSPTLADIDQDGYPEFFTSGDNWSSSNPNYRCFVTIYEHDGTVKEGWPIYFYRHLIGDAVTPADIDGDGILEIGFSSGGLLYFMHVDSEILPGWPSSFSSPDGDLISSNADIITTDLDGDGDYEIFIDGNILYPDSLGQDSIWYYGHSWLAGGDHLGRLLSGFPIRTRGVFFGLPPTFALKPNDNRLYMSVASQICLLPFEPIDTLFIELYQFPDSTGPPDQWPMLNHDNLHTRNYNFVDRVTSIYDEGNDILPKTAILKQNYPNPFNFTTMIEFTIPKKEYVTLSVFDILGRKVIDLYDQEMEAGNYRHRLSMNVPSGVYLYNLKAGDTEITRKMTLLK